MKFLFATFLTFIFSLFAGFSFGQSSADDCRQIERVLARLGEIHYQPVEVTSTVKGEMIQLFLNELDTRNRIFSADQVEKLKKMAGDKDLCTAFAASQKEYLKGIQRYDSLLQIFAKSPVKFQKGENVSIHFSGTKPVRKSDSQLKQFIQQMFKYNYLNIAYDQMLDDSTVYTSDKDLTPALDKICKDKVVMRETVYLKRLRSDSTELSKKQLEIFLNAIALRFDPHSTFFSSEEMNSFEDDLSKETTSFGIQLVENENFEMEVTDILPGSAAWFSGEFTEGDILESIVTKSGENFELSFKGMNYLFKILKNPLYAELNFNLRKKSGEKLKVNLTKTEIENVDNSFKGYVMQQDSTRLGYIALPSFYTDFESDAMLGCANDVTKEILLLKKENIHGLVLDLRYNGGGSIKEAVELCGLFIPEGPVCVLQGRNEKPYVMKDMNRGTVYDGPLIVLVNNMSASASEVVAGCLQDYQRALIVGDVTFGKGTAQAIFPVNAFSNPNFPDPAGYLKITDGKFYHVSSRSNQLTGVVPDLLVKDIYASIDFYKEKNELFRLDNDSTAKKVIYTKFQSPVTAEKLKTAQQKIDRNPYFKSIRPIADSLKMYVESDQVIPLEFLAFVKYSQKEDKFMERLDSLSELENPAFQVKNGVFHEKMLNMNQVEKEMNEDMIESMKRDAILQETISIFREFYTFDPK